MGTNKGKSLMEATELRRRAEEWLNAQETAAQPPLTEHETQRLLHELQVHQIELEMQNAELLRSREEAETALRNYAELYDYAPVSYFTLDRGGTIKAVNFTGAVLMGLDRSRLIGRRFDHFVAYEARPIFAAFLGKIFTNPAKEVCAVPLLIEDRFAPYVQIEGIAAPSVEECRVAVVDISDRKRAEEALLKAKESAEATGRAKSQFLANMSHELRTPMTGILGLLQFALEEDLPPVPRGFLESTQNSARSLLRILNDILDMAKIEAGKCTLEEKPFSPQGCVTEVVDLLTPEVRRKGLHIAFSIAKEMPATVVGDQLRLRQVLTNLIGNAVKFTEKGEVALRVTAGRAIADGKREFTFAVTDTGIGIPDDKKDLLFKAFSQVDDSHSRRHGGTGLGLAISREIVEQMGGTIGVKSKEGVGSTFSFTIPLGECPAENAVRPPTEPQATETLPPTPEGERVPSLLIAEDEPNNRKVLGLLFKRTNYNLDFAVDGLKAVEMWEKGKYDLVLMDVQMPRLNGFEATSAIRERELARGGHVPIVAMTAHAFEENEKECLDAGMDAYISKPFDIRKCVEIVQELLDKNDR